MTTCPLCVADFNASLTRDDAPLLHAVWVEYKNSKSAGVPFSTLVARVCSSYEYAVRRPLLRDGENCREWSSAEVRRHLRYHI